MFLVDITDLPRYFEKLFLVQEMASNHPVRVIRFFYNARVLTATAVPMMTVKTDKGD